MRSTFTAQRKRLPALFSSLLATRWLTLSLPCRFFVLAKLPKFEEASHIISALQLVEAFPQRRPGACSNAKVVGL